MAPDFITLWILNESIQKNKSLYFSSGFYLFFYRIAIQSFFNPSFWQSLLRKLWVGQTMKLWIFSAQCHLLSTWKNFTHSVSDFNNISSINPSTPFMRWLPRITSRYTDKLTKHLVYFPCGSAGKESACNAGDLGSIPRLGRSPGEGIGYPLQYSWVSHVA